MEGNRYVVRNLRATMLKHAISETQRMETILAQIGGVVLGVSGPFYTTRTYELIHVGILKFAWTFLLVGLISLVLSFVLNGWVISGEVKKLRKYDEETISETELRAMENKVGGFFVSTANFTSSLTTILGLVLIFVFFVFNIH